LFSRFNLENKNKKKNLIGKFFSKHNKKRKKGMLFNSNPYEKSPEIWAQQLQQQHQHQLHQPQQLRPSTNQQKLQSPTRLASNHQPQMQPNKPISPNTIYGALLHYHMQQNHQQEVILQQQLRHENFLLAELGSRNLQQNNNQFQLIQQAAALAAAQQLTLKTNFMNKKSDELNANEFIATNPAKMLKTNDLNSPASSTTSSSSSSADTIARTSLSSSSDDLASLKMNSSIKSLKRPYLKFSMDAILGTQNDSEGSCNGNKQSSSKRLCIDGMNSRQIRNEFDHKNQSSFDNSFIRLQQQINNCNTAATANNNNNNNSNPANLGLTGAAAASNGKNLSQQQQPSQQLNNNNNEHLFPIGIGK
jgi:hypothetical protein